MRVPNISPFRLPVEACPSRGEECDRQPRTRSFMRHQRTSTGIRRRPGFLKLMLTARPVIMRLVWCSALKANGMNRSLTVVTALSVVLTCAAAAKSTAPVHVPLPRNNPLKNTEQENQQNSKPAADLSSGELWQLATTRAGVFKGVSNFRRQGRLGR
jgi:hypothetical protein